MSLSLSLFFMWKLKLQYKTITRISLDFEKSIFIIKEKLYAFKADN